jgi:hypothetical protein
LEDPHPAERSCSFVQGQWSVKLTQWARHMHTAVRQHYSGRPAQARLGPQSSGRRCSLESHRRGR